MAISSLNGVSLANIAEVNGVQIANIAKINGEDVVLLQVPSSPTDLTLTPVTGPAVLFEDTFTAADQNLEDHTPTPGPGAAGTWDKGSQSAGRYGLRSEVVIRIGGTSNLCQVVDAGVEDCVISCDLNKVSGTLFHGVAALSEPGGIGQWRVGIESTNQFLVIVEGGAEVARSAATLPSSTGTLTVTSNVTAGTLQGEMLGVTVEYNSLTNVPGHTTHGILGRSNQDSFDNFKVTELP